MHELPARYHRQMLLPAVGTEGQNRLAQSHALIAGCGALGCMIADSLARAGVGRLTIVDRDIVELTNLQRQVLYTETDVADGLPKSVAAQHRLAHVNSQIEIRAVVDDLNPGSVRRLLENDDDVHVLVDGLDNFETRYLLNDASVRLGIPYVYGGAVATNGMTVTFLPHRPESVEWSDPETHVRWDQCTQSTPCLRCIFPEAPPAGSTPTCDTAGVLGPIVTTIASMQAAEAIKIMIGAFDSINRDLVMIDLWSNEFRRLNIRSARNSEGCPCCALGHFDYLQGQQMASATSLCGRNSVQILPSHATAQAFDFESVVGRLESQFNATRNRYLLKVRLPESEGSFELTIFPNGRVVVSGTDEPSIARSVYAKYVGA